MKSLDSLLDGTYEDATFHDSELLSFEFDFARAVATFEFDIQCRATSPDQQFTVRRGTVEFSQLCFCAVEPTVCQVRNGGGASLWITSDGPLPDERLQLKQVVPDGLPDDALLHYLYSNSTNSVIVVGAKGVTFRWRHTGAHPS